MNQPVVQLSQASLTQAELPNLSRSKQTETTIFVTSTTAGVFIPPQNSNALFASLVPDRLSEISSSQTFKILDKSGNKLEASSILVTLSTASSEPKLLLLATRNGSRITLANESFKPSLSG